MDVLNKYVATYGAAVALCLAITVAVFPGFMSYDSLHALEQSRFGITSADWPPFVSYVWHPLDIIWRGPALMHLVQNGLLLCSVAYIISWTTNNLCIRMLALLAFVAVSPVLGPMLVVWKDIPVASCFSCAVALMIAAQFTELPRVKKAGLALTPLFIFGGMAYRFNASSAALPLLWWWALLVCGGKLQNCRPVLLSLATLAVLFSGVLMLSWYRLPDFARFKPNAIFDTVMLYDLVGISRYSNQMVMHLDPGPDGQVFGLADLKSIYTPEHGLKTLGNLPEYTTRTYTPARIKEDWKDAVRMYPAAYFHHRMAVFRVLLGATSEPVFYPTHPGIDKNDLGLTFTPTKVSIYIVNYVVDSSKTIIGRPWLYYLTGLGILFSSYITKKNTRNISTVIYTSGILYLIPQFILNPAADLRYNFWSIVASLLTIILGVNGVPDRASWTIDGVGVRSS